MPDDDATFNWREGIKQGRKDLREELLAWTKEQRRLVNYNLDMIAGMAESIAWDTMIKKLENK